MDLFNPANFNWADWTYLAIVAFGLASGGYTAARKGAGDFVFFLIAFVLVLLVVLNTGAFA